MKRIDRMAVLLGASLALAGCDDDFLVTIPPDQVSDAIFWTQEEDAVLAVNALYPLNLGQWVVIRMEGAADNGWAQKSFDAWYPIGQGTMQPLSGEANRFWQVPYQAIRRANEVLENIDDIPSMNASLRERLKGEALFHRAYHYNLLVNLYGDVPLVLGSVGIPDARDLTRNPASQVVDQILQDLDAAAAALPVTYPNAQKGRATRGAALAYKARAALYAGRYQEAAAAAKAVMDLNVYQLHPNYADLTRYAGNDSPETIYADRFMQAQRTHNSFSWLGPRSMQGGSDITPLRNLVDFYQMEDGLSMNVSPLFDADTPYANRDPRMYHTLLYPGATFDGEVYNSLPGSGTPDEVRADFNATSTGFQFIRYVDPLDRSNPGNSGIDFILMRYAEVLLTYAEAMIELNQIDQSVYDAINAVRTRAGMPAVSGLSQDELREILRYERRVEFVMEGLRLFDIRRWRIAEHVMPGQHYGIDYVDEGGTKRQWVADARNFNPGRDYLWPIPQRERDLAPGIAQNPGY